MQAVHSGLDASQAAELFKLCNEVTNAVDLAETRVKVRLCPLPSVGRHSLHPCLPAVGNISGQLVSVESRQP